MKMKLKMGILLISIILLSATAIAAPPATKPTEKLKANFTAIFNQTAPLNVRFMDKST